MNPHAPDPLYSQAVEIVRHEKRASVSLVQSRLFIGYHRAEKLLEKMEKAGVVTATRSLDSCMWEVTP